MTLQATSGIWMPMLYPYSGAPSFASTMLIDATGEKAAFIGRVWNKDRESKNISRVQFRFGAVTKAGGSGLTVSLQDVDLANGPPYQPDGTQDQTVAIGNADASFATNTWYRTGTFGASRTVAFGELVAVVFEYDGSGRLGADSVAINSLTGASAFLPDLTNGPVLNTGSWAIPGGSGHNNIILEFDDGTFGTLGPFSATSSITTTAFNSGSGADELALAFTVPFKAKVDGIAAYVSAAASADFELHLYDGTSSLANCAFDSNSLALNASPRWAVGTISEQTLTPGTQYYVAVKPMTANNVSVYDFSVNTANHFQAHPGGTAWSFASRVDAGAWSPTTTRRLLAAIRFSALSDDAGGGARVIGG